MSRLRLGCWVILTAALFLGGCQAPGGSAGPAWPGAWTPDLGNGSYQNPILYADYSDPDVVRVGDDFYLTSSSFTCVPGLPVLHSRDLVNWTIIGHALPRQVPEEHFDAVQSGGGVWAPSIRYHDGKFYIFYPDPDYGIYVVTATDPAGPWSAPILVKGGRGLEDPCPLWDDDGRVYLVHAWVGSRAGRNNILTLLPLSDDATHATGDGQDIILGRDFSVTTLEGPKFYKMNGYYWIFAPVGGVGGGTEAVFRAKNITGPYEVRIVLAQGGTKVNGPHQGGLVDTPDGRQWWFVHFQDAGVFGRITHLEPVSWRADGWPVMGLDPQGTGTGEPVAVHAKPDMGRSYPIATPQTTDEFNSPELGLQWQWLANPRDDWFSLSAHPGFLRLYAQPANAHFYLQPNLLLQKIPGPKFTVVTRLEFSPTAVGEKAGLVVYGTPCVWIGLEKTADGLRLRQVVVRAGTGRAPDVETEVQNIPADNGPVCLAWTMSEDGTGSFAYGPDTTLLHSFGQPVKVAQIHGSWIGAKFGVFAIAPDGAAQSGYADFDWVRVGAPQSYP
jgi:beta-xylosidase